MKIICVGINYQSHKEEIGQSFCLRENEPVLFLKPDSAILHSDKNQFYIPDFSSNIHYEAEIVVKISKMGKNIAERFAYRYYDEITLGLDFTARDLQTELRKAGLPWEISKAFDNSAFVGKWLSKDLIKEGIGCVDFHLQKNNTIVQQANSSEMIYSIDQIIAYASKYFTLKTGDLIFTGTPAGVGKVEIGDILKGYIENIELFEVQIC